MKKFLVARLDGSSWQRVSVGQYRPGVGAAHSMDERMTEAEHAEIERAVCWMADDPAVTLVTLEAGYRVSWC